MAKAPPQDFTLNIIALRVKIKNKLLIPRVLNINLLFNVCIYNTYSRFYAASKKLYLRRVVFALHGRSGWLELLPDAGYLHISSVCLSEPQSDLLVQHLLYAYLYQTCEKQCIN